MRARLFYVQYALAAVGVVPQRVFLVDYIARDLDRGVTVGSSYYLIDGVGTLIARLLYGATSKIMGARSPLRMALLVQLVAAL